MHVLRRFTEVLIVFCLLISSSAPQAADSHWTFDLTLEPSALSEMAVGGGFGLPQFRAYDSEGRQVLDIGSGFSPETFAGQLEAALRAPEPAVDGMSLEDELVRLMQPHGSKLPPLPGADFTLVKYWAEWCVPCKALDEALSGLLSRYPDLRVNILNVEADPTKRMGGESLGPDDAHGAVMIDASSLPDDLRQRLMEGTLTPEDHEKLAEIADESGGKDENEPENE